MNPSRSTPRRRRDARLAALVGVGALLVSGVAALAGPTPASALDNDLALTPPMGWNSWNQVRCYDLNEDVVKDAADAIAATGMAEAGYEYVVVDDCWQGGRGADGVLFSHPERFPSGMKALGEYIHSKGLKFGIYGSPGSKTCANRWDSYPILGLGSLGHERIDAQTYEEWGVDYLKYDWCDADVNDGLTHQAAFAVMRDELARLDRPIVYGISEYGNTQPWTWASDVANLWRTTQDIAPNWGSVLGIIDSQAGLADFAGPGGWNDPDMLQVGNGAMTIEENRSHFGMWAMLAAPLFAGTDLTALPSETLEIITNPEVIAVDQDPLGQQAHRLRHSTDSQVWARPLAGGDIAVALMNTGDSTRRITTSVDEVGGAGAYVVRSLWERTDLYNTTAGIWAEVPAHGTALLRLTPGTSENVPSALGVSGELTARPGVSARMPVTVTNGDDTPATDVSLAFEATPGVTMPASVVVGDVAARGRATVEVEVRLADDFAGRVEVPVRIISGEGEYSGALTVTALLTGDVYVSDLPWTGASNGFGPPERDRANGEEGAADGPLITLDGTTYDKGVGTNPEARIPFRLSGQCAGLHAVIGIDDDVAARARAGGITPRSTFEVYADGRQVFYTEFEQGRDEPTAIEVDIAGADLVELRNGLVGEPGDPDQRSWFAWTDWADAHVSCEVAEPVVEIGVSPAATTSGWHAGPATITLTGTGALEYSLDDDWLAYSEPVRLTDDGEYLVRARAATNGRVAETTTEVRIDSTPPDVALTADADEAVVTAADAGSGLARLEYTLAGEATVLDLAGEGDVSHMVDLSGLGGGVHPMSVTVADRTGHEATATIEVTVDPSGSVDDGANGSQSSGDNDSTGSEGAGDATGSEDAAGSDTSAGPARPERPASGEAAGADAAGSTPATGGASGLPATGRTWPPVAALSALLLGAGCALTVRRRVRS